MINLRSKISKDTSLFALSATLILWQLLFAVPIDLYAHNTSEVGVTVKEIFKFGLPIFFSLFLLAILVFYIFQDIFAILRLKGVAARNLSCLAFSVAVSAWANSVFLVGQYGEIDGRGNLQIDPGSYLSVVQLLLAGTVLVSAHFFYGKRNILQRILTIVFATSFLTTGVNVFSAQSSHPGTQPGDGLATAEDAERSWQAFTTFSETNPNVLFILLDEYQSDLFGHILDDELLHDLDGFIWFRDAISNFPTTNVSMPAIFSTRIFDGSLTNIEFLGKIAEEKASFSQQLETSGFNVSFTTDNPSLLLPILMPLFPSDSYVVFPNVHIASDPTNYSIVLNLALFRISFDLFKNAIYSGEDWIVGRLLSFLNPQIESGYVGQANMKFEYLEKSSFLAIPDHPATFKYYHSLLTHSPTWIDDQCKVLSSPALPRTIEAASDTGKCAISRLLSVFNELKRIGVYDNTIIIVASDHGSEFDFEIFKSYDSPFSRSASTLLIKPLRSNGRLAVDEYPAQLSDIPKTVLDTLKVGNSFSGVNLVSDQKPSRHERTLNYYFWFWAKEGLTPIQYRLSGPARKSSSWHRESTPLRCDTSLAFGENDTMRFLDSRGLSSVNAWGRWSLGSSTTLSVVPSDDCQPHGIRFLLDAFFPEGLDSQTATVFINDDRAGEIEIRRTENRPKAFEIPISEQQWSAGEKLVIRFNYDHAASPFALGSRKDTRELAFGFVSMTLLGDES